MVRALTLLIGLQLAGEAAAQALSLTIPGPVLGMAALLGLLALKGGPSEAEAATARGFLDNLGLLFVPAGVGVMLHLGAVADHWPALAAAVIGATLLTIIATAWVFVLLSRLSARDDE